MKSKPLVFDEQCGPDSLIATSGEKSDNLSISILNMRLELFLIGALIFAFVAPGIGLAQDPTSVVGPTPPAPPQAVPIGPPDAEGLKQSPSWEMRPGRSYLIPAVEIL
ncbi:MAG: hypothetical protein ABI955_09305, partial [Nitrospirota bacterium]